MSLIDHDQEEPPMNENHSDAEALLEYAIKQSLDPERQSSAESNVRLAQVHALLAIADAIRDTPPKDAALPDQGVWHDPDETLARALLVIRVAGGDDR